MTPGPDAAAHRRRYWRELATAAQLQGWPWPEAEALGNETDGFIAWYAKRHGNEVFWAPTEYEARQDACSYLVTDTRNGHSAYSSMDWPRDVGDAWMRYVDAHIVQSASSTPADRKMAENASAARWGRCL